MMDDNAPEMDAGLSPDELASILRREYDAADNYYEQIEPLMEAAFRFYEAQPFGNEVEGRSQIVLPDVQETCDYMNQSVLRTFLSGDRVIELEATDDADEQAADDATAAIDYRFMREQDGARVLGDVLQDGNLKMLGIFKALCDYEEKVSREWQVVPLEGLPFAIAEVEAAGGEIEQIREGEDEMGQPVARVLIKTQRTLKRHRLDAVPVREFRFSANAKHEDEADYVAHVRAVTRSDLVSMGFDPEQVYDLPTHNEWEDTESEFLDYRTGEVSSEALAEVLLCEEYARIDVDADGIAERVKCFRVENEILRWAEDGELAVETVDEQPFAVFCPFPRPHRLVGYALAQKVMDIQYARSEIARQINDGMAYANMPRPIVAENGSSDETLDDLLNPIPGSPIRVRDQSAVQMAPNTFDVSKSLAVMEWMSGERESRTGITRMNQGLDADALNKTATGTALMQAAGQLFEEAIAYQMASAFARGAMKLYRMMRLEAEPFNIKVDGKSRRIDPSTWPESMNVRIRVGLGTNSKDKRIQARMALTQIMAQGTEIGEVSHENRFNMVDGLVRDMGIGQGEDYWTAPPEPQIDPQTGQPIPPQEKPDPAEMQAQQEAALKEREQAAREQEMQGKLMIEQFRAEQDAKRQEDKQNHEMALAEARAQWEADLAQRKAVWEAQNRANMTDNKPGGRLDA